jgi:hypothetical protein
MVAGWIRTGSELSENHDHYSSRNRLVPLKFHRSAPPRLALAAFPGPAFRGMPDRPSADSRRRGRAVPRHCDYFTERGVRNQVARI